MLGRGRDCRSAPYVKPYYGLVKLCYGFVIRGAFLGQLSAGNTPVGSDLALEGRKCLKKVRLGGVWPLRAQRADFEGEDARKIPKCGTSMDRGHRDLSVPVPMRGIGTPGLGSGGCKKSTRMLINASVFFFLLLPSLSEPANSLGGLQPGTWRFLLRVRHPAELSKCWRRSLPCQE